MMQICSFHVCRGDDGRWRKTIIFLMLMMLSIVEMTTGNNAFNADIGDSVTASGGGWR